ncbi:MAG: aryl-sulfate sulfotransferase [Bacteroidetes bacterium]|nr:aryl-sulfate sulfotransferase [Bacteroidota bacterium]
MTKTNVYAVCALLAVVTIVSCKKDKTKFTTTALQYPEGQTIIAAPFTSDNKSSTLLVMDNNGNIHISIPLEASSMNFHRWDINGKIRYTYQYYNPYSFLISGIGYIPGYTVLMDENMNVLKHIYLQQYNGRSASDPNVLDGHDFILFDDDHYISMAYYKRPASLDNSIVTSDSVTVVAPIIQEVRNGNVVWEWDGSQYPEFYSTSVEGNDFSNTTAAQDYMHMNSMIVDDKDGNLICSFRNLNQIVKINRKTGNIIWRLGGKNSDFAVSSDQQFLRQHDVTLTDGGKTLLVFDNGDFNTRPYTRICEYQLDENSRTISSFKAMKLPNNTFCRFMGSVQKTDSSYFIGCGSTPQIMEVNYNTGAIIKQITLANQSYRVQRY